MPITKSIGLMDDKKWIEGVNESNFTDLSESEFIGIILSCPDSIGV